MGWMKDAGRNLSERERALWIWVNVVDLDGYLQEVNSWQESLSEKKLTTDSVGMLQQVYEYYVGKGLYCIALRRILNLL
jgi:autophagy-related protein 9